MKTKEEILGKYYSHNAEGFPEISADGLQKAMEEYKDAAAEAAFNAARQSHNGQVTFADYQAYKASVQPLPQPEEDHVQLVADSIVTQFLPDDPNTLEFSFDLNTRGASYTAHYMRSPEGCWQYAGKDER